MIKKNSKRKSSKRRIKNKSSKRQRRRKISRKTSTSKVTWEKFLKNNDSRKALQNSWKADDPQKYYKKTILKLARKYSNSRLKK